MFRSSLRALRLGSLIALSAVLPACNGTLNNPDQPTSAPSFGGAASAAPGANPGEVTLTWSPAVELNGGTMTYLVFASLSGSGTENLGSPIATTTNGTGIVVTGLTSHDPYWFIVQAEDSAGTIDGNVNEVTATPP